MSNQRYYNRTNTCDICKKDLTRDPQPRKEYNKNGDWSGKWTCNACHHIFEKHGTYDKEEILKNKHKILENSRNCALNRKCSKCGNSTYITPSNRPMWYKNELNEKHYICKKCYDLERGNIPNGLLRKEANKRKHDNLDNWKKSKNIDREILTRRVSIGWLREKAKRNGFDSLEDWNKSKNIDRDNLIQEVSVGSDDVNEYEKGSIGWLRNKAKKNGFNSLEDWNKSKNADRKILARRVSIKSLKEDASEYGFENNVREFVKWARQNGISRNHADIYHDIRMRSAKNAGFDNISEYMKDYYRNNVEYMREYARERTWKKNSEPMSENKDSSSFFGVFVGEGIFKEYLLTIFENVEKMDYGNPGFDFICKNPRQDFIDKYPQLKLTIDSEYKIQLEVCCLYDHINKSSYFKFHVKHNNTPDYYILVGFNTRECLDILHIWMFHRNDMIRKGNSYTKKEEFWKRNSITITDDPDYLERFKYYEIVYKLNELKDLCNNKNNEIN